MQKLVIYLPADLGHPECVLVGDSSHIQQVSADALANVAESSQVIVIVPSEEILLTSVKLPKMNRSRIAEALPYALEEQIIHDVETMHFVPGEMQADGSLPVAIVAREKMQAWLDKLKSLNVQPDILMPSIFALPLEDDTWTIVLHDMALVRMHAFQGFSCDITNLNEILSIALSSTSIIPAGIHVYNHRQHAAVLNTVVNAREEMRDERQFIADLAKHASALPAINLLQGMYKAKKTRFPEMKKIWKVTGMLTAAWLVLLFLYPVISLFILNLRLNGMNAGIEEIYKRYFPQATNMTAPKLRMEGKLQGYTAYANEGKWLMLIATLGKGMTETRGINLNRLDLQQDKLTLQLSATSADDFAKLTDYLTQQGLSVKQQSVNLAAESRVNAVITVE